MRDADATILAILAGREMTALQICQALHEWAGAVYPNLARLEAAGRVESFWVGQRYPRRRVYRIARQHTGADRG